MNPLLIDIRKRFREIYRSRRLLFSMNNIVQITGLSRTRLNYWQKRGYIHSIKHEKNRTRVYTYMSLIKIELMESYLRSGFTLKVADQKASKGKDFARLIHNVVMQRLQRITTIDGDPAADFGPLRKGDSKHLYFVQNQHGEVSAQYRNLK